MLTADELKQAKELLNYRDKIYCGNSSCYFGFNGQKKGMQTNGGCRCFRQESPYLRIFTREIAKLFPKLLAHIEALQKENERKDRAIEMCSNELSNSCKCFPNSSMCGACVLKVKIKQIIEGKE